MHQSTIVAFHQWARRHRAFFAVLLSIAVLFNVARVFAAVDYKSVTQEHTATAGHVHAMQSACCPVHSFNDAHCCQGVDCSCTAHCASLWLSQQFPDLHHGYKSNPQFPAENTP
ncbi:MAG: hypothetical protein P8019_16500, partial [Gammaproteobacteria bacterium]